MVSSLAKAVSAEFDRALKLQNSKKPNEAEAVYRGLLTVDPAHADAYHNLGLLILERGSAGLALPYLLYSLHLRPDRAEAHNTAGNAWRRLGKRQEAEASYRSSTALNPKHALAWFNLANLLAENGREPEAEKAFRSAISAKPDFAEAYLNLGNILRNQNRHDEALASLQQLVKIVPKYDLAHNNLGNLYRDADRLEDAEASYRRATELNPGYALAWLNLGTVLNHLGRKADSVTALKRAIDAAPRYGEPYMQLASTMKVPLDAPVVESMRFYFQEPSVSERDKMHLAFALGRVFDDNGQSEKAIRYFMEGNRLKRATLNFNIATEQATIERIRARFTKEFIANAPRSRVSDATPVFIVGMMRSGSTLMEQILSSHPDVAGADELQWMPEIAYGHTSPTGLRFPDWVSTVTADELTSLGQNYIDRLRRRFGPGPRLITDKLPGNFLFLGLIHLILPNARIIHMVRDPYDTCFSIYTTLFANLHHYAYDLRELGQFYRLYADLMKHWDQVLPGKIYHQRYEELVGNPEASVRKVLDFCGLPFDQKCLEFYKTDRRVKTASSQQVREQLHSRSIGRWRSYEKHLGDWKAMFGAQA